MAELLPTRQARNLVDGLTDYLTTTFALSDKKAQEAIEGFLTDPSSGMFKGPYLRLRLPFEPADEGWRDSLDHYGAEFPPYGHQAQAFRRLSSKPAEGSSEAFRRPQPTLVTTGTGSGKTESFLFPILDHVLRAQRAGITGVKALILYPMNALANDQAGRLARLISGHQDLSGVRAALYTGEQEGAHKTVTAGGLITDRAEIRSNPPDILLTNYKMLDMLLLRHEDSALWCESATSLQYLVLDEFHSYDGAQGTDVAMLLRRLGLALKSSWPGDLSDRPMGLTEEDRQRPLGRVTPVATSATLGGTGGADAMLAFASTIFGEPLDADALITESRMSVETWRDLGSQPAGVVPRGLADLPERIPATNAAVRAEDSHASVVAAALEALFDSPPADSPQGLLDALRHHPLTERLLGMAATAVGIRDLTADLFPTLPAGTDLDDATEFLAHVIALYSHVRAVAGRQALTVETHLWVRELSRIESSLDVSNDYRWGDDGILEADQDHDDDADRVFLPAIFCRHCGKSGWGAKMAPTGTELVLDAAEIRAASLQRDASFRALLHAANEAEEVWLGRKPPQEAKDEGLRYFHTVRRTLGADAPAEDDEDFQHGRIIPVITHAGPEAKDLSRQDVCPSCLTPDAIRFVGSAIATLTSVAVTTLFGARDLDDAEKKALVFTDSVQDAAHRAGFIQARSHTFNLRNALRTAFGDGTGAAQPVVSLSQLVDQAMAVPPHDAVQRFRLVPPELTDREGFRAFWDEDAAPGKRAKARDNVKRRLAFDAALELGLQSRLGRTLELTGSVVAEVDAGTPAAIAAAGRRVWEAKLHVLDGIAVPSDEQILAWVRGVLVRMRLQGGIYHPWLERYIRHDGARYHLWGGRPRHQGMPAFPSGRPAPAFPVVGPTKADNGLDPVTPRSSWYATWTGRALGVKPDDAGHLARELFEELARLGVLAEYPTDQGARAYSIPTDRIYLSIPTDQDLREKRNTLECEVCRTRSFGTAQVMDQLEGAPCQQAKCAGRLARVAHTPENYYRQMYADTEGKRVVAREHTSLLAPDIRLQYEDTFKATDQTPDAPNVLVATPTLEMGIDIGDLSCVMLASMPASVASYVQRVGRAGRLTGNSLVMAFVRGRGEHLPKLYDPLSVINGQVRPPSTYLEAEEILTRQFTAYLGDQLARDPQAVHPRSAREALKSTAPDSYLGQMLALMEDRRSELVMEFLGQFSPDVVSDTARERLAAWAGDTLPAELGRASQRWQQDRDDLQARIKDVEAAVAVLEQERDQQQHAYPTEPDGDPHPKVQEAERDVRSAKAQLFRLYREAEEQRTEYWISTIELYGLFPNYTLIGDPVLLDVGVSWRDEETQAFEADTETFSRSAGIALHELAPGATFYARGMEIEIDAVDLGPNLREVQYWQVCPACGWKAGVDRTSEEPVGYEGTVTACPRCGAPGIADIGNVHAIVVMKKVTAEVKRDEAVIGDSREERVRTTFHVAAVADIDPEAVDARWFVEDNGFGAEYLSVVDLTWFNLGANGRGGASVMIAGDTVSAPRFTLCEYCGKLDQDRVANSVHEHRFWCRHRKSTDEHTRQVILARELRTQGVKLHLPEGVTDVDSFTLPTLKAAIMLGLREHLGGTPDHLGIMTIPDATSADGRRSLLLHDAVPGGTGYLSTFRNPQDVFGVLAAALTTVSTCSCAAEQRRACHRCLLPFADHGAEHLVSRVEGERLLRDLLGFREEDTAPDYGRWTIRTEPLEISSGESALEIAFRRALKERLAAVNADVTPKPGLRGERLVIKLPTQDHRWTLEPQVDIHGTRPDFLLRYEGGGVPDLAIYTDGRAFHADPAPGRNRVGDDAKKRYGLRLSGYVPWAITNQDVKRFAAGQETPTGGHDPWVNSQMLAVLTSKHALSPDILRAMTGGSMEMLWAWMNDPHEAAWQRFSSVVAGLTLSAGGLNKTAVAAGSVPGFQFPLESVAQEVLRGPAWWEQVAAHLHLLTAGDPTSTTALTSVLCLDDRPEAVASAEYAESWRRWLYWSNLLVFQASPKTALVGTTSAREELMEMAGLRSGAGAPVPGRDVAVTGAPVGGNAVVDGWVGVFAVADDDADRSFLERLATARLEPPSAWGEEMSGVMTQLAWEDDRVAVVYDLEEGTELAKAGWTLVSTGDVEGVLDALGRMTAGEK
jgi:ATP-dependent helicase YprA (DUF1998 family)